MARYEEKAQSTEKRKRRSLGTDIRRRLDFGETHEREPKKRTITSCRRVKEYTKIDRIGEGAYGFVYRARNKRTGEVVAVKKVKLNSEDGKEEEEGFPVTYLREINMLMALQHPSIVDVKEVVVGNTIDGIFLVMEYMEHDVKRVMDTRKQSFSEAEAKCLMLQLLEGVMYMHDNWVIHRDLKTSNLLLDSNNRLKICDFGLARQYASPVKPYTPWVGTLWYRPPELMMGAKEYTTAFDMWSVGCIMAELLAKEPLFDGQNELQQIDLISKTLGTPDENICPGFMKLPFAKLFTWEQMPYRLREKFPPSLLSESGFDLLSKLLNYDPQKRITAEDALRHPWFSEVPLPKSPDFIPTLPALNDKSRVLIMGEYNMDSCLVQLLAELKGDAWFSFSLNR